MSWSKAPIDSEDVRKVAERYGIELLEAAILVRRGISSPEDILYVLEDDLQYLHNPFLMDEMEDAVDRVLDAVSECERVLVFGDRDVDGITGTVLLVRQLHSLGLDVEWRVPAADNPYGVTAEIIEEFAARNGTLLITVDCGTTSVAEIARAAELGIDTIVIDHHNPRIERPQAVAIVNPKLPDSSYPFDGLSGCGVVAKLCWALAFSATPLYKVPIVLLQIRPANDTFVIEAVKLENLVTVDRLEENVVPGMVSLQETRVAEFLLGNQILVYDAVTQKRILRTLFGEGIDTDELVDLEPEVARVFPTLRAKSLLALRPNARITRYRDDKLAEVDLLHALFRVYIAKAYPALGKQFQQLLDLVALGTVGDMMPLRNENRILVKRGLEAMNALRSGGLARLLHQLDLSGRTLTASDLGWKVAPVINASGRMGEPETAVRQLLSADIDEQRALADRLIELNRERRRVGDQAWKQILPLAERSYAELSERLVLVQDESVHRGVTGIIAGKLARHFKAPAAVVTRCDDRAVGSVRTRGEIAATDFLERFDDILLTWGGHDLAAGFNLEWPRLEEFAQRVRELIPTLELGTVIDRAVRVDAELPHKYLQPELERTVSRFEPFGQGNPPLVFLARNVVIENLEFIGRDEQKHLKLLITGGPVRIPAVYWNGAGEVGRSFQPKERVDVVFELGKNFFQNSETVQLTVLDMKTAEARVGK